MYQNHSNWEPDHNVRMEAVGGELQNPAGLSGIWMMGRCVPCDKQVALWNYPVVPTHLLSENPKEPGTESWVFSSMMGLSSCVLWPDRVR